MIRVVLCAVGVPDDPVRIAEVAVKLRCEKFAREQSGKRRCDRHPDDVR
jgi:hypothetical protein